MDPILGAIAVVLVASISGWVTLRVSHRTKSGKIDTTEAAKLWDEGTLMRGELRDKVVSLEGQLRAVTTAMLELNQELRHSHDETTVAREETRLSREETRLLMIEIKDVKSEIKTANALSIGALADNTETRRILEIPKDDRTNAENEHVATASDRIPQANLPDIPTADQEMPDE